MANQFVRLNPCPVCGLNNKNCWKVRGSNIYHCNKPQRNFTFTLLEGKDKFGFSRYLHPSEIAISTYIEEAEETIESKDKHIRFSLLVLENKSKNKDRLKQRNLDEKQINLIFDRIFEVDKDRSLGQVIAGTDINGVWRNQSGLYVATKGVDNLLRDGQILTNSGKPKYIWGKSHVSKKLESGNLPYQYACFTERPLALCITEGILKPLISAALYPWYAWLGFSGGRSTQQEIDEVVEHAKLLNIKYIFILPDAGSFLNDAIVLNYRRTYEMIAKKLPVAIVSWQQLYDKQKLDCDEVNWQDKSIYYRSSILYTKQEDILDVNKYFWGYKGQKIYNNLVCTGNDSTNWLDSIKKSSKTFHLVNLPVGAGKSHAIGDINIDNPVYYLSLQPDLPATKNLAIWDRFPIRYSEIKENKKSKNKVGKESNGNCLYAYEHTKLLNATDEINICSLCEKKQLCSTSQGEGYGYLYEIRNFYKDKIKVRIHAKSLTAISNDSYIIIDEVKSACPAINSQFISFKELYLLEKLFSDKLNFYFFVRQLENQVKTKFFGIEHEEILKLIGLLNFDDIDIKEENTKVLIYIIKTIQREKNKKTKTFLPSSILYFLYEKNARFYATKGGLQIITKNNYNHLFNAEKVIFLDATLPKEILNLYYDLTEVTTYFAKPYTNNLLITVVPDFDIDITNQSNKPKVIQKLQNTLIAQGFSIITWKKYATEDSLVFLSTSRGSNKLEKAKKIAILGLPRPHYGVVKEEWLLLEGQKKDISLKPYYDYLVLSELEQAIGRLRNTRRKDEALECLIISKDFALENLPYYNSRYQSIKHYDIF